MKETRFDGSKMFKCAVYSQTLGVGVERDTGVLNITMTTVVYFISFYVFYFKTNCSIDDNAFVTYNSSSQ